MRMNSHVHALQNGWFCIYARARHEQKIASTLQGEGLEAFCPTRPEARQWRDRVKTLNVPLFPGYLFVRSVTDKREFFKIIDAKGVVRVLGNGWPHISQVPDEQIAAIKFFLRENASLRVIDGLTPGERVRIKSGAFNGVEGVVKQKTDKNARLILTIACLNKSLEVTFDSRLIAFERIQNSNLIIS